MQFEAELIKFDQVNLNGRVYTKEAVIPHIDSFKQNKENDSI